MKYIFLHGLGQTPSSWNDVVKFIENPADVLCPDLALLLRDREINYSNLYTAFSEYCMELAEPFNICGLSLGGIIALQYCIEHPQKVNSMVLIGTQYVMPKKLLQFQNVVFRFMPNSAFKDMGFGKYDFINLSKSMMELNFQSDLKNINCPVLVVCGEKDKANKQAALQLKEQIPTAKFTTIEKAGHEVNIQAPQQLSCVLSSFFRGQSRYAVMLPGMTAFPCLHTVDFLLNSDKGRQHFLLSPHDYPPAKPDGAVNGGLLDR